MTTKFAYLKEDPVTISRESFEATKRYSADARTREILEILENKLDQNKTRTMTFTEDGLGLAINLIRNVYGIED
jgi:hypothetical protein